MKNILGFVRRYSTVTHHDHLVKRIRVFQCDLPLKEGTYKWSDGKSVSTFDSTIVEVTTKNEQTGYGEATPLGPFYLPAYAEGVRAGIDVLAPHLIGQNALDIFQLNVRMDMVLKGHPYVKSPIDVACWDLLGKHCELPLVTLLGGRCGEDVVLYRAISQSPPAEMTDNVRKYQAEGYTKFQLKVGSTVEDDISRIKMIRSVLPQNHTLVADANTGWLVHEAMQIVNACRDESVYIEEPCNSYANNVSIRQHAPQPFVLDECIDSIGALQVAINDGACDVVNVKISKLGGLTKAKQVRDLCIANGIAMCIEDTWGGDIVTASIAHLAHSTPQKFRFSSTDFNSYNTISNAFHAPKRENGRMKASDRPGLGIVPNWEVLGSPVAVYE